MGKHKVAHRRASRPPQIGAAEYVCFYCRFGVTGM